METNDRVGRYPEQSDPVHSARPAMHAPPVSDKPWKSCEYLFGCPSGIVKEVAGARYVVLPSGWRRVD